MRKKESVKCNVEILRNNNSKEYEKFILDQSESNIYHTLEWKEVIDDLDYYKSSYLIARDKNGNIQSALPLFIVNSLNGRRLISIPHSMYGGIIGNEQYVKVILKKALELKFEKNCKCLVIKQSINGYNKIFNEFNMKCSNKRCSQSVIIKKPNIMWQDIKPSNKNSIRKSIKNDIEIEQVTCRDDLFDFQRLALITIKRTGMPVPPITFFQKIWDVMHDKGYAEFFFAKYKGKAIASCLIFPFNNKVILGYANSDISYLKFRPNNYIIWKILEWCYEKKYRIFDLGSTWLNNKGLYFFKATFNTIDFPVVYYYYPKNSNIFDDITLIKFFEKIIRILPIELLKIINPILNKHFS